MTAPLFQRFVEDELALAPALVARVLAGTVQLLGPSRDSGTSVGERSHHSEIVKALQRDAGLFEKTFVESLAKRVREETDGPRDASLGEGRAGLGGLELMDDPWELPDGYDEPLIWHGLGLTPFAIVPHFRSRHPEAASAEKVVSYMRARRTRFRAISDGEVIVRVGNLERLAS